MVRKDYIDLANIIGSLLPGDSHGDLEFTSPKELIRWFAEQLHARDVNMDLEKFLRRTGFYGDACKAG